MYLFKLEALKCASHPLSGTNELLSYYGSEANVDGSPACSFGGYWGSLLSLPELLPGIVGD